MYLGNKSLSFSYDSHQEFAAFRKHLTCYQGRSDRFAGNRWTAREKTDYSVQPGMGEKSSTHSTSFCPLFNSSNPHAPLDCGLERKRATICRLNLRRNGDEAGKIFDENRAAFWLNDSLLCPITQRSTDRELRGPNHLGQFLTCEVD